MHHAQEVKDEIYFFQCVTYKRIYSSNTYLLRACYVPVTLQGTEYTVIALVLLLYTIIYAIGLVPVLVRCTVWKEKIGKKTSKKILNYKLWYLLERK